MRKNLYYARKNFIRSIMQSWFTVFSGALLSFLFIISSIALWYGSPCIVHNGQKVCYISSDD